MIEHERAIELLAERLDGPLAAADAALLDAHLVGCSSCRAAAEAFGSDRLLFRDLPIPEPPRDMWARTSAALDRERSRNARRFVGGQGLPRRDPGRASYRRDVRRWGPLAGLSTAAALILVVALGASGLLGGFGGIGAAGGSGGPPSAPATFAVGPTPLTVPPNDVAWVSSLGGGLYQFNLATIGQVCPTGSAPDCAPLDGSTRQVTVLPIVPTAVVLSPSQAQAVVVADQPTGGGVYVVPFPTSAPVASPMPEPTVTPVPTASPTPAAPTSTPTPAPTPTLPATPEPPTGTPAVTPTPVPTSAPGTPVPIIGSPIAIATNVTIVGNEAAYSPDGHWFAFSARPSDGSTGPDIWVWETGTPAARPLTSDHASIFSAWVAGRILGSRAVSAQAAAAPFAAATASPTPTSDPSAEPGASPGPPLVVPQAFLIDPMNGTERVLDRLAGWRPAVDPTGRWVVYWAGSLKLDPVDRTWVPDVGLLEVAQWAVLSGSGDGLPGGSGDSASPGVEPTAGSSADVTAAPSADSTPSPGADPAVGPLLVVEPDRPTIRDWELRWDPSGTHLALWIADPLVPGLGVLSVLALDPVTGRPGLDSPRLLSEMPAQRGFSIGDGRIVWVTPPGQDANGARIQVLAWQGKDAGQVTTRPSDPNENLIVVH